MVYYVDPVGKTKEKWLRDNATEVERAAVVNFRFEDSLFHTPLYLFATVLRTRPSCAETKRMSKRMPDMANQKCFMFVSKKIWLAFLPALLNLLSRKEPVKIVNTIARAI